MVFRIRNLAFVCIRNALHHMNHSLISTAPDSMIFHKEEINRMSRIELYVRINFANIFPSAKCLVGQGQPNKLMEPTYVNR